jgi:hypothetical protein
MQLWKFALRMSAYFPYFSFPYTSMHRRITPAEFHMITGIRLDRIPYVSQHTAPAKNANVKGRLISWALLSFKIRKS